MARVNFERMQFHWTPLTKCHPIAPYQYQFWESLRHPYDPATNHQAAPGESQLIHTRPSSYFLKLYVVRPIRRILKRGVTRGTHVKAHPLFMTTPIATISYIYRWKWTIKHAVSLMIQLPTTSHFTNINYLIKTCVIKLWIPHTPAMVCVSDIYFIHFSARKMLLSV